MASRMLHVRAGLGGELQRQLRDRKDQHAAEQSRLEAQVAELKSAAANAEQKVKELTDALAAERQRREAVAFCEEAIARWRDMMGATNYKEAAEGTIRRDFATDIEKNVVHGSDAPETAAFEIGYFFNSFEIVG